MLYTTNTDLFYVLFWSNVLTIDPEFADDIISSFDANYDELQHGLNKLGQTPDDATLINLVFRSFHTIKGNAAMAQIQPLVDFTHALEETVDAMRRGDFSASEKICDLLLLGTDRLRDLHLFHLFGKALEAFDQDDFIHRFITLSQSSSTDAAETTALEFYQALYPALDTPNYSEDSTANVNETNLSIHRSYITLSENSSEAHFKALDNFRELALRVDQQNNFWHDRTDKQLYLAINLSQLSNDRPIDNTQLLAAIYMHDVGMAFLSGELINKQAKLTPEELSDLHRHITWGYELLAKMPLWTEAATMVAQHHEKENGLGYPNHLHSEDICDGAKIIAILDAFYAMTNLRGDRTHRRSILRAISEINACTGTQFDPYWVNLFNQLIKNEVKKGNM
ncbi:MAG: chemotaxis protein histidine kinase CheA [Candidatus Endobugula sp.]|jgi:chemotaxis protein histidine kinase CheA